MAFDIYGNQLRAGFCEVHPDIQQPYPCSICLSNKANSSAADVTSREFREGQLLDEHRARAQAEYRDKIALEALNGLISGCFSNGATKNPGTLAEEAYEIADAMLEEREKRLKKG